MVTPDPRLVAALQVAMPMRWWRMRRDDLVAAILPAFLADPRTHEWLAGRLATTYQRNYPTARHDDWVSDAAFILGVEP